MATGLGQQQTWIDGWWNWAYQVLNGIGAPTSQTNITTLWNWSIKESGGNPLVNGSIHNNPLNTTQGAPGSVSANSAGVQSFPDISTGAAATVQTLLNGRYQSIVAALRSNTPTSQWASNPAIVQQLTTWGSGSNWLGWNNQPPKASSNFQNTTQTGAGIGGSGNPLQDAINAALSPVGSAITGATNTLVEKLTYGAITATGVFLMALGFIVLILPILGRGAGAAASATPQGRAVTTAAAVAKPKPAPAAPAAAPAKPAAARVTAAPEPQAVGRVSSTSTESQIRANRRKIGAA